MIKLSLAPRVRINQNAQLFITGKTPAQDFRLSNSPAFDAVVETQCTLEPK